MHITTVFISLLLFLQVPNVQAEVLYTGESEGMRFQVEEVASGLGIPWGIEFIAADELIVTERDGMIKKVNLTSGSVTLLPGAPEVWARGQGGLLDVAVPDDFKPGDWIYFAYSKNQNGQGVTTLARAHLKDNTIVDWQDIFITKSASNTTRHFGSRIVFDGEGHLFFSIGDRGVRPNGQNLATHSGTIIRLNLDGSIPEDNPFVNKDALPEIWSYGHRNPQGMFWEKKTGQLWSNEHGPRGGDEINRILPGENYGWPIVSHGKEYWGPKRVGEATSKPGMIDPLKVYIPSIAPSSLLIYSGKAFPGWQGNFFSGALAMVHLNRLVFDENDKPVKEEQMLIELDERIRDVIESPEGWLYLSTDSGRILRILKL